MKASDSLFLFPWWASCVRKRHAGLEVTITSVNTCRSSESLREHTHTHIHTDTHAWTYNRIMDAFCSNLQSDLIIFLANIFICFSNRTKLIIFRHQRTQTFSWNPTSADFSIIQNLWWKPLAFSGGGSSNCFPELCYWHLVCDNKHCDWSIGDLLPRPTVKAITCAMCTKEKKSGARGQCEMILK